MSVEEFNSLITDSGALRYEVSHGFSEMGCQFNLSMMTHIDEINFNKHLQMFYYEFLEAISRVTHKIKIFPNIDKYQQKNESKMKSPGKDLLTTKILPVKSLLKTRTILEEEAESDSDENMSAKSFYEIEQDEISHIINVENQPLHAKLEIFIKL